MDPWLTPLITFLAATVGGFASYFGSRHSKSVDHKIAKDKIEFDYRQKRIEYKMQVFGDYIYLMQQFSDITDKRWTNMGSSDEWRLSLKNIVTRLDKSPARLFLKDDEVKVLDSYNSKVFDLASTYLEKLSIPPEDIGKLTEEAIPQIDAAVLDKNPEEALKMVMEIVTGTLTERIWPHFDKAQIAAEESENNVKEVLRRNLQADLS